MPAVGTRSVGLVGWTSSPVDSRLLESMTSMASEPEFCVQFAAGDLKWMSHGQLQDAYHHALINPSTMVYQQGQPSWRPLGQTAVLGRPRAESSYHVELLPGEVKRLTREQVNDAVRTGVADESTQAYCPRTRQWKRLADVVELDSAQSAEADDVFHVEVAPGDVKCLTLEQLDDFYRLDVIQDSTMVWREGGREWQTLGALIGCDAQQDSQEPAAEEFYVELASGEVKCLDLERLDDAYRLDIVGSSTMVWRPGLTSWHSLGELAGLAPEPELAVAPQPPSPGGASLVFDPLPVPPKVSPWFGRVLMLVAGVVGVVAAYRNDLPFGVAQWAGEEAELARFEARLLGAPGIDTPRGVQLYLRDVTVRYGLDGLSPTTPVPPADVPRSADDPQEKSGEQSASAEEKEAKGEGGSQKPAKADAAPAKAKKTTTVRRSASKRKKPERAKDFSEIGVMGGDPYDPLNGQL